MERLSKDQIMQAMELKLAGNAASSVLALVEDCCAYTGGERAAMLHESFANWLLFEAPHSAEAWIRSHHRIGLGGKDWIRLAMHDGFRMPHESR